MILHCSKTNQMIPVDNYRLSDVNKEVRAYINHRLYCDSEAWATKEERTFTGNPLKPLMEQLVMFGAVRKFKYDVATTIYAIPLAYILDHVGIPALLQMLDNFPSDWFWVENLECEGMVYESDELTDKAIVAKDLSVVLHYVEPSYNGNIVIPKDPNYIKSLLANNNGKISAEATAKVSEIQAISYPDFDEMTKAQLVVFATRWNLLYPNRLIDTTLNLAPLRNAIKNRMGVER